MKILFTNLTLASRTGTEMVTRDLALGVAALGHEPMVFSPELGGVAEEIRAAGIPVVDNLQDLFETPDIIHGHHHVETTLALLHFPSTPAVFVCHDRLSWHDVPPRSEQIRRYVAVDRNCLQRLTEESGVPPGRVDLIHNSVDTKRFVSRSPLPVQPKRALIFSNYAAAGSHTEPVKVACSLLGIQVDVAGSGSQAISESPEQLLPDYDLVFAKARCALESMAAGAAVILCDTRGLGPLVTVADLPELRDWNFGMRCLQQRLQAGSIIQQILKYDAGEAAAVSSWIRQNAALEASVSIYLQLYREAIEDARRAPVYVQSSSVLKDLAVRSGNLETRLRSSGTLAMLPLPSIAVSQVKLRPLESLRRMVAGSRQHVNVEITNASNETLASIDPNPIHLSYRWLDPVSGEVLINDGERTGLTANVHPGSVQTQPQMIEAPAQAGRFILRFALVQEFVRWFGDVDPATGADIVVDVFGDAEAPNTLPSGSRTFDLQQASQWCSGVQLLRNAVFSSLGFLSMPKSGLLTFVESQRFADQAARTDGIACIITTPELASRLPSHIGVAVCSTPREAFTQIHNHLAKLTAFYWEDFQSVIDASANIYPGVCVPEFNVVIGRGVVIEANVTIGERLILGEGCIIQAGAVLGGEGFQTNRTAPHLSEMAHAGSLRIEVGAKIFSNAVIARGVFRESTRIGLDSRIGNGAFVSHNVQVGSRAFVGHGAVVNGNVRIEDDAWVGPNATLANSVSIGAAAHVGLGATVIRDVEPRGRVMGPLAAESRKMLRLFKQMENE